MVYLEFDERVPMSPAAVVVRMTELATPALLIEVSESRLRVRLSASSPILLDAKVIPEGDSSRIVGTVSSSSHYGVGCYYGVAILIWLMLLLNHLIPPDQTGWPVVIGFGVLFIGLPILLQVFDRRSARNKARTLYELAFATLRNSA